MIKQADLNFNIVIGVNLFKRDMRNLMDLLLYINCKAATYIDDAIYKGTFHVIPVLSCVKEYLNFYRNFSAYYSHLLVLKCEKLVGNPVIGMYP